MFQAVNDFLLQCFQKDPNLRITAKKLLRHPWIQSAQKSISLVPAKPTKYDEAVKTVQEWNEALKSPENTMRRQPRADAASPIPNGLTARPKVATSLPGPKVTDLQKGSAAVCPSPDDMDNNIWDDDFASSISTTGLQLPAHLKPVDNFGGALSSEKLKAYATTDEGNVVKLEGKGSSTNTKRRDTRLVANQDPLETVRAPSPVKTRQQKSKPAEAERPSSGAQKSISQPKTQILRGQAKSSLPTQSGKRPNPPRRSSSIFKEESTGDYSDLIVEDEDAFDQKVNQIRKASSTPVIAIILLMLYLADQYVGHTLTAFLSDVFTHV